MLFSSQKPVEYNIGHGLLPFLLPFTTRLPFKKCWSAPIYYNVGPQTIAKLGQIIPISLEFMVMS